MAISIEETNLHKRIALGALRLVGSNPRALMFGFMFVTWVLSMCIANTSTTGTILTLAHFLRLFTVVTRESRSFNDEKNVKFYLSCKFVLT